MKRKWKQKEKKNKIEGKRKEKEKEKSKTKEPLKLAVGKSQTKVPSTGWSDACLKRRRRIVRCELAINFLH